MLPDVYTLNQVSGVATFYDSEKINSSKYLYVPELQKCLIGKGLKTLELIKDITEGRSAYFHH